MAAHNIAELHPYELKQAQKEMDANIQRWTQSNGLQKENLNDGNTTIKLVVIGDNPDHLHEKLLETYTSGVYPGENCASFFDNYRISHQFGGRHIHLDLWNIEGKETTDRYRRLIYSDTNVFILLYNESVPDSYECIRDFWSIEANNRAPIILVAHKEPGAVSQENGQQLAAEIGAVAYTEFSFTDEALHETVKGIFAKAMTAALLTSERANMYRMILAPVPAPLEALLNQGAIVRRPLVPRQDETKQVQQSNSMQFHPK